MPRRNDRLQTRVPWMGQGLRNGFVVLQSEYVRTHIGFKRQGDTLEPKVVPLAVPQQSLVHSRLQLEYLCASIREGWGRSLYIDAGNIICTSSARQRLSKTIHLLIPAHVIATLLRSKQLEVRFPSRAVPALRSDCSSSRRQKRYLLVLASPARVRRPSHQFIP